MPSIRIKRFGGMNHSVATRNADPDMPQFAHNCLLWDGALRPLAKWISKQGGLTNRYTLAFDGTNLHTYNLLSAFQLKDMTYPAGMVLGLNPSVVNTGTSNICYQNNYVNIDAILEVGVAPPNFLSATQFTWTAEFQSKKPVNRLYAGTFVRNNGGKLEESALVLLPNQSAIAQYFEGDSAWILARPQSAGIRENCYFRLYRSMSGLSTGQELDNKLDTDWYLCAELKAYVAYNAGVGREYSFIDNGSVTTKPLDKYLANHFYPPYPYTYNFLCNTEGGWIVAATAAGNVAVSERHMTHAWPTENYGFIPAGITDMVAHYDTVYFGTSDRPYVMALAMGDAGLQMNILPAQESYPCIVNTMAETPSGVIYASPAGLVSMSQEGLRNMTPAITNSPAPLYHAEFLDSTRSNALNCVDVNFADTTYGTFYHGMYFGFGNVAIPSGSFLPIGYIFDTGSSLDGERSYARISTFDYINPNILSSVWTNNGLAVLDGAGSVWEMAFPNMPSKDAYKNSPKQTYIWKSKKFVLPGLTTFGACKIIHDCGCLRLRIYVDGCCTYDTPVTSKKPFTLPADMVGVEYEFELEGTANVYELHVATSTQDLTDISYRDRMSDEYTTSG